MSMLYRCILRTSHGDMAFHPELPPLVGDFVSYSYRPHVHFGPDPDPAATARVVKIVSRTFEMRDTGISHGSGSRESAWYCILTAEDQDD